MSLSKREKTDILRTCDSYFDKQDDSYKVNKADFINLIRVMLENENKADHLRGANIWKKL